MTSNDHSSPRIPTSSCLPFRQQQPQSGNVTGLAWVCGPSIAYVSLQMPHDPVGSDAKQIKEKGKATSLTPLRRGPRSYQTGKNLPRLRLPRHHIPDSGHDTFLTPPPPRTKTSALISPTIRPVSPKPRPENPHICIQYIHLPRQREPEQI